MPLRTVNGIGVRLLGKFAEAALDPYDIRQQFLTVLFIPIFPLRFYLVRDLGGHEYEFIGAVPYATVFRCYSIFRIALFYAHAFWVSVLTLAAIAGTIYAIAWTLAQLWN